MDIFQTEDEEEAKEDNQEEDQNNPSNDDEESEIKIIKMKIMMKKLRQAIDSDYDIDEYKLDEQLVDY